jgi:hypothetical protein
MVFTSAASSAVLVVVKVVLLVVGLAAAGMAVGYRRLLKALAAVGIGALMLYGLVFGVWLYVGRFSCVWRLVGGMLIAAVVGAAAGLMSGRRAGFAAFGLVLAASYVLLVL